MPKTAKQKMTSIEKAIRSREMGIKRMKDNIGRIRKRAEEEIAGIERRMVERQVLLDALKRGQLK